MSRISERALVRLVRDSVAVHSSLPLAARNATSSPEAKPAMTVSPVGTGAEAERMRAGSVRAWYVQSAAPVSALKASSSSSTLITTTRPPTTVGEPWNGDSTRVRQITLPVAASTAATNR